MNRNSTKTKAMMKKFTLTICLLLGLLSGQVSALELESSPFEQDIASIRMTNSLELAAELDEFDSFDQSDDFVDVDSDLPGKKSPLKAFGLSALVPGLGQLYNGSKIKAISFFGVDVATWALHFSWHADANGLEDDYEAFNRAHWNQSDYETYLLWVYGETDDELISAQELSHNLPDTRTQQYYEMTGKYDQFAWGWDDAVRNDSTLSEYSSSNPPQAITSRALAPYTARRLTYEQMRDDANNKFDDANRLIIVALVNRLISGFEAYFSAKNHNKNLAHASRSPMRLKVRAQLKSIYESNDTPFLHMAYRF